MFNTICLSGGGISGFLQLSCLKTLIDEKLLNINKIKKYVGTSVGSMISFLLNLNYTVDEILEFSILYNFNKIVDTSSLENIFDKFGINNGEIFINILSDFLYKKTKLKDITFEQLYKISNKKLGIVGTNFTKNREEYFSIDTTPKMSILKAIRISISVPFMFSPVRYNNDLYIDGGIYNNFPINYCNKNKTFGICMYNDNYLKSDKLNNYISGLIDIMFKIVSTKNNFNKENVIIMNGFKGFSNYEVNDKLKVKLINYGQIETYKFIKKHKYFYFKKLILEIINNLFY